MVYIMSAANALIQYSNKVKSNKTRDKELTGLDQKFCLHSQDNWSFSLVVDIGRLYINKKLGSQLRPPSKKRLLNFK